MATKTNFSADEWQLLLDVPVLTGFLVSVASESGPIGTLREIWQSVAGPAEAAREHGGSALIQALEADLERHPEGGQPATDRAQATAREASDPAAFGAAVLEKCRAATALLREKASPGEAREYADWVLASARSVAEASKEGGFLGLGGQKVSPEESTILSEIATALGMEPA